MKTKKHLTEKQAWKEIHDRLDTKAKGIYWLCLEINDLFYEGLVSIQCHNNMRRKINCLKQLSTCSSILVTKEVWMNKPLRLRIANHFSQHDKISRRLLEDMQIFMVPKLSIPKNII